MVLSTSQTDAQNTHTSKTTKYHVIHQNSILTVANFHDDIDNLYIHYNSHNKEHHYVMKNLIAIIAVAVICVMIMPTGEAVAPEKTKRGFFAGGRLTKSDYIELMKRSVKTEPCPLFGDCGK